MENAFDKNTQLVFGLDIGTRNVVGTVGYKDGRDFYAVAQCVREHETRAMLDGQIHDIGRVGRVIAEVKKELERQIEQPLTQVCIAAAGRVLKTVTTTIEYEFQEETIVDLEALHTLDLLGIDKAQGILSEKNDTKYRFYCVGYSVVRYYLNEELFTSLEGHKAKKIGEDIIVTFLPEDVVDGLYAAVENAGLEVANLTLEPIAAINVAIPEAFRMLNIALVDVGAGTSDLCITRDGSIIAYGMIPYAGDELTELIVHQYLVDFNTAEHIKLTSGMEDEVEFMDIMQIKHKIPSQDVWDLTEPTVDKITTEIADKIKELNGGHSVSATFIVGGGGKIHGFAEHLADKLELPYERVALRGEEVMQSIHFAQEEVRKDPLLVTPIGICLNYYEQKNNFIMVRFNGELIKLYDNNHLTVVDAALLAGFPNEQLFPRRGKAMHFTVNGKQRVERGEAGESAVIRMNGNPIGINTPLEPNCEITIEPSTEGSEAVYRIEQLDEYTSSTITFIVNNKEITCAKFVEVNGSLEPGSYEIQENDVIETRNYYTLAQLAEFMDVVVDLDQEILVNNRPADMQTLVYENFEVEWTVKSYLTTAPQEGEETAEETGVTAFKDESQEEMREPAEQSASEEMRVPAEQSASEEMREISAMPAEEPGESLTETEEDMEPQAVLTERSETKAQEAAEPAWTDAAAKTSETHSREENDSAADVAEPSGLRTSTLVVVNGKAIVLDRKPTHIFVDIFDYIDFDLSQSNGRAIVTKINDADAQYTQELHDGDKIDIYWKENGS